MLPRWSDRRWWVQVPRFTRRDLWERDRHAFGPFGRALITTLRIGAVVWEGFSRHALTTRAGALTYVTIFSLVPTLAVAFAMFRAFGGLEQTRAALLEALMRYLAVGVRDEVTRYVDAMLTNLNASAIGAAGLVFLIIAVVSLLSSIEDVFNEIWGVQRPRSWFERLTFYWTVVTVSPTLIVLGVSLPGLFGGVVPVRGFLERTGTVELVSSILLPWLLAVGAFSVLYGLMTARRIPLAAALVGGLTGGTLWFIAVQAYAWYAASTVYYANIYGSLAAIPIFIFWLYVCWVLVFVGAQVAFAWQNLDTYREEILSVGISPAAREQIALCLLADVTRRFLRGEPPACAAEIAAALHASARSVNEVAGQLVALGMLRESGEEARLLLAGDPHRLQPADVLVALRMAGEQDVVRGSDALLDRVGALYAGAQEAGMAAWDGRSFADVVAGAPEPPRRETDRPAVRRVQPQR